MSVLVLLIRGSMLLPSGEVTVYNGKLPPLMWEWEKLWSQSHSLVFLSFFTIDDQLMLWSDHQVMHLHLAYSKKKDNGIWTCSNCLLMTSVLFSVLVFRLWLFHRLQHKIVVSSCDQSTNMALCTSLWHFSAYFQFSAAMVVPLISTTKTAKL